jgi:PAS domain-containing protein
VSAQNAAVESFESRLKQRTNALRAELERGQPIEAELSEIPSRGANREAPDGELLRRLADSVRVYGICMLDPQGRIASWNTGAQEIMGYSSEAILGTHFSVLHLDTLAATLRAELDSAVPRLIALSGYGQQNDRDRSRQAGFDAHLVKPIDGQRLIDTIVALDR